MTETAYSPLLIDRSTIEIDWECQRKRWWYREFREKGIVPVREAKYFREGRDIHEGLAKILMDVPLGEVLEGYGPTPTDVLEREPFLRKVGWTVAFAKWVFPRILDEFLILKTEWEVVLERDPLWIVCTPDALLRRRTDGALVNLDFKSVGIMGREWMNYWPYAVQMQINMKAIEEEVGEKVEYSQIIGLMKGKEDRGKLRHPYVWAYTDGNKWSHEWKKDWGMDTVDQYPGGIEAWVELLGEEEGMAQFPFSARVFPNDRLLEGLIRQRTIREQLLDLMRPMTQSEEAVRDIYYPQSFSKCRPSFGSECPYLAACHNADINTDPIGSGMYVERTPHHDVELVGVEDE